MDALKKYIKANKFLYQLLSMYTVRYTYGYIHSILEIEHLRKKLCKIVKNISLCGYDERKKDKFIFIGDKNIDSTMRVAVFGDIDLGNVKTHDCTFWTSYELKDKKLINAHKIFYRINKIFPLPGKKYWEKYYTIFDIRFEPQYNYFVIFLAGAYFEETFSQQTLWEKVYKAEGETFCQKVLYLVDPVDKFPDIKAWFPFFDIITSCAYEDQFRHGIHFIDTPCVNIKINSAQKEDIKYNVYLRAQNNNRVAIIQECAKFFSANGVSNKIIVQDEKDNDKKSCCVEITSVRIPYIDMLKEELQSNVLLEIVTPSVGAGATLRYREAVMYKKKLLTNNRSVFQLKFYDGVNIRYFARCSDIDVDWVNRQDEVSYPYNEEFSVDTFCNRLKELSLSEIS